MELALQRSQRDTGILSKKVAFALTARVKLTEAEHNALARYKFGEAVIYQKENVTPDASGQSMFRNLAAAALNLTITVNDLVTGRTIECKDIIEMMGVQETVIEACENLKNILATASNFDGEEVMQI